ncbi:hypothetical protein CR513_03462, partial [Mucuna pruriens]
MAEMETKSAPTLVPSRPDSDRLRPYFNSCCLFALDVEKVTEQEICGNQGIKDSLGLELDLASLCISRAHQATSWGWKNNGFLDLALSATPTHSSGRKPQCLAITGAPLPSFQESETESVRLCHIHPKLSQSYSIVSKSTLSQDRVGFVFVETKLACKTTKNLLIMAQRPMYMHLFDLHLLGDRVRQHFIHLAVQLLGHDVPVPSTRSVDSLPLRFDLGITPGFLVALLPRLSHQFPSSSAGALCPLPVSMAYCVDNCASMGWERVLGIEVSILGDLLTPCCANPGVTASPTSARG